VSSSLPISRTAAELKRFGIRRWRSRGSSSGSTLAVPVRQQRPSSTRTRGSASMLRT
jgi:hypothetical protein